MTDGCTEAYRDRRDAERAYAASRAATQQDEGGQSAARPGDKRKTPEPPTDPEPAPESAPESAPEPESNRAKLARLERELAVHDVRTELCAEMTKVYAKMVKSDQLLVSLGARVSDLAARLDAQQAVITKVLATVRYHHKVISRQECREWHERNPPQLRNLPQEPAPAPAPAPAPLEEDELDPAEEEMMHNAELAAEREYERLNGPDGPEPPDDDESNTAPLPEPRRPPPDEAESAATRADAKMAQLLQNGTLRLAVDLTNQRQYVAVGPHGQRNDIFANKETFKIMSDRFFFDATFKRWDRNLPDCPSRAK